MLDFFTPTNQVADLARWLEFVAGTLTDQPRIPLWTADLFNALCRHEPLEHGVCAALIRSLPPLVDRLVGMGLSGQQQRAGLARLLTRALPAIDPIRPRSVRRRRTTGRANSAAHG